MRKGYDRYSILDFGKYLGYEVGIVFIFDRPYLEWCLTNIEQFCIFDWDILVSLDFVVVPSLDWQERHLIEPEARFGFKEFESIRELEEILSGIGKPIELDTTEVILEEEIAPTDWELVYANGGNTQGKAPTVIIMLHGHHRKTYIIIKLGNLIYIANSARIDIMKIDESGKGLPDPSTCRIGLRKGNDLILISRK